MAFKEATSLQMKSLVRVGLISTLFNLLVTKDIELVAEVPAILHHVSSREFSMCCYSLLLTFHCFIFAYLGRVESRRYRAL